MHHCSTQCPHPSCRPLLTHASAGDSWTLTGNSGSVSWVAAPFSPWCWRTQGFVCALQVSVSPVLYKFWGLYGGVNGNLLQEGLCHLQVIAPRSPAPAASHCCPQETLNHSKAGLTQSLWLSLDICPLFSIKLEGKNFLHLHITF